MMGKRKRYTAEFKARVALAALRGELTAAQLATKHGVHQTMIAAWKKQAVEGLAPAPRVLPLVLPYVDGRKTQVHPHGSSAAVRLRLEA